MTGIFRMFYRVLMTSSRLVSPSKKRFLYLLSLFVCLALLGLYIISYISKAHADTPTPSPSETQEENSEVPPGIYPVPLISRGTWGYGPSYLRYDVTSSNNNFEVASYEFTGVQGWYNYIEFGTIALSDFDYDGGDFDKFGILYQWQSDNVLITVDSVVYNNTTYYDGETGFQIGDFLVQWYSERGNTELGLTFEGDMNDIQAAYSLFNDRYLTLNVTYSISSPDTVTMYGTAAFIKEGNPEPIPDWITPTPFPEPESQMQPDNSTTYNGIFSLLGNAIQWVGITIKEAIDNIFGDFSQVTALISGWMNTENESGPFYPVYNLSDDILSFTSDLSDFVSRVPTSARIDFDGYYLEIPDGDSSLGQLYFHGASSDKPLIPAIHRDIGADLEQLGLATYIRLGIRFMALVGFIVYIYNLYGRIVTLMAGQPAALAWGGKNLEEETRGD